VCTLLGPAASRHGEGVSQSNTEHVRDMQATETHVTPSLAQHTCLRQESDQAAMLGICTPFSLHGKPQLHTHSQNIMVLPPLKLREARASSTASFELPAEPFSRTTWGWSNAGQTLVRTHWIQGAACM
jgi:hypothetical protein